MSLVYHVVSITFFFRKFVRLVSLKVPSGICFCVLTVSFPVVVSWTGASSWPCPRAAATPWRWRTPSSRPCSRRTSRGRCGSTAEPLSSPTPTTTSTSRWPEIAPSRSVRLAEKRWNLKKKKKRIILLHFFFCRNTCWLIFFFATMFLQAAATL